MSGRLNCTEQTVVAFFFCSFPYVTNSELVFHLGACGVQFDDLKDVVTFPGGMLTNSFELLPMGALRQSE